jgi:hypothetical protein
MEWFFYLTYFIKVTWSVDSLIYLVMILIGVLTLYIGYSNESSKPGKILISIGLSLFMILFIVLLIFSLLNSPYAVSFKDYLALKV